MRIFVRDIDSLFPGTIKRFSKEWINEALTKLMCVSEYLFAQKGALILFDPTAFNNQCHLYALMTVKMAANYDGERIDKRFVNLAFLLTYSNLTDVSLLWKLVEKIPKDILGTISFPERDFEILVKDPYGERTRAARLALNNIFKDYIKSSFNAETTPVYDELLRLANSEQMFVTYGNEKLYTLPKFSGVTYFIDTINRYNIPLIFKVKVLTKDGAGYFQHPDVYFNSESSDKYAIVFEMIAYDEELTREKCLALAKKCPRSSECDASRKNRHDESEICLFCNPSKIDVAAYQEKYLPVLENSIKMLYALSVAFIQERQPQFLSLFNDTNKYPELTNLFQLHVPEVEKSHLSSVKTSNIYVSHVYADSVELAAQHAMIMDASYEAHLCNRNLI